MKNSKGKILGCIFAILVILAVYILLTTWNDRRIQKKLEDEMPTLLGKIEEMIPDDDLALTSQGTMAEGEYNILEHPYRLLIKNRAILAETTLPTYGLETLEPYLTEYFDYYWDNGTNYYAEIIEGSFKEDYNLPSFKIYVEDLELEIECVWYSSRQIYHFYSRFNPEGQ